MYVCLYLRMHACMHVVCILVMYIGVYLCMCDLCMRICKYMYVCICLFCLCVLVMYVGVYYCMFVMYICMYMHLCVCMYDALMHVNI